MNGDEADLESCQVNKTISKKIADIKQLHNSE